MRLVVLGKSPAWPDPGGACSGYLIEEDGFALLLDCGAGVFSKLSQAHDYLTLGAVLISHLHADHILDLVPFSYALGLSPRGSDPRRRPPLHCPPGSEALFRRLGGCWNDEELILTAFEPAEYDPLQRLQIGPFAVRFCEVPHYVQAFACEISAGGARITFGADCGPNQALVDFARGSDLLILEATLTEPDTDVPAGHMTPGEAGELARQAEVKRLLVTHFSEEVGSDWVRAESTRGFGAEVTLAAAGAEYVL